MRSKTLAYAIGMSCATLGAASTTFMPPAAWAQATSTAQGPTQAGSFGGGVAAAQRLTLSEALSLAETANPTLHAKQAQLAAAEGVRTDANALLFNNPQLSVEQTRRSVPLAAQSDERRKEWSAGLSQTLEIAGQRGFRREAADAALAGLVVLLLFAGLVIDEPFAKTFYRAMAVLVAASPCALAISVPSAVLSGVARAARGGVLVKGGGPLENLGTLTSIAFDKTGTLTEGKPRLTDVVAAQGATEEELLSIALAVEQHSDHPLASAIVTGARERLGENAKAMQSADVKSITGRGVQAQVDGETVHIGKPVLFSELPNTQLPS